MRALRVIEHFRKSNLDSPERLKLLLCPILARGKADQSRFYELFDQYWEQVMQPWEMPVLEKNAGPARENRGWMRWLVVLSVLTGLGFIVYLLIGKTDPPELKASFRNTNKVILGEQIYFENLSENHDSLCTFRWDIFSDFSRETNRDVQDELEFTTTDSFHLTYTATTPGKSPFKRVRLTSIHPGRRDTAVFEGFFTIFCKEMPAIDSVAAVTAARIGEPVDFQVFTKEKDGLEFSWDMGDASFGQADAEKGESRVRHVYQEDGRYQIHLKVSRQGAEGFCQYDTLLTLKVGGEKAYLAAKTLQKDTIAAIVNFSYGLWVLMGLLGVPIIWFWVKWAVRPGPSPGPATADPDLKSAAVRFQSADKAPYKIPFRSHNNLVQVDKDLYRLADVMRQRQEGLRREMDVATSVKETIAEGGFPQLLTKADEVPTEFLFLVDEQQEGSHQSHLFQWLVNFLRQREVLGELFFFRNSLHRFWNSHFPEGLSPDQLHRMYGFHKLVVLGDGHGLLDITPQFERQRPQLRSDASQFFGHWNHRFLLTPMPVVSWTYREGSLHDRFAIFPMDTGGLINFVRHLEHEVEDEERPPYKTWCNKLLEKRQETDLNYRTWRTAADHRDFLKGHPHLYKWLAAIALYPKVNWEMTLAIGAALSPVGVELTYDHLLILSRIPWLQNGDLSPNLRYQLIESLDDETERLAREAIEAELQAVAHIVGNGFANLEHQTNLALQSFALRPQDAEAQRSIRQLMALGLLTPRHFVDINQGISRTRERESAAWKTATSAAAAKMDRSAEPLQTFLQQNEEPIAPPPKPFFTRDFWWALACSSLFVALFLLGWNYGGTDRLAQWADIDTSESTNCQDAYSHFYFLKKECITDSAVVFNNRAVGLWENMAGDATGKTPILMREVNRMNLDTALAYFAKAISLRPEYGLAISNREKLLYNIGVQEYHAYLADSADEQGLERAKDYFNQIELDSFQLDALHGEGLAEYYLERSVNNVPDISRKLYEQIMSQDSFYFSTISTYPHLQSLLAIQKEIRLKIMDAATGQPVAGVIVTDRKENRFQSGSDGVVSVKMIQGERRVFDFSKNGYESFTREIVDSSGVTRYNLTMKKEVRETPPQPALVSDRENIYFDLDQAAIRPDAAVALDSLYRELSQNRTNWELALTPYYDADKNVAYNQRVAQRRADAVRKYLQEKGIAPERMTIVGGRGISTTTTNRSDEEKRRVALRLNELPTVEADDDGDGVPNSEDDCPTEAGSRENNGCPIKIEEKPEQAPPPDVPQNLYQWVEIKSNFIPEPRILKNKDYYDTFSFRGYDYRIILEELNNKGRSATFTIEKDLKQEARVVVPVTISDLAIGEKRTFEMDGIFFRLENKGQERRRIGVLMKEVTLYSIAAEELAKRK